MRSRFHRHGLIYGWHGVCMCGLARANVPCYTHKHARMEYLRRWASGAKHRSPSQRSSAGVTIVTEGWASPLTLPLFYTHTHTHTHTSKGSKKIMAVTSPFSTLLFFTVAVSIASCSASVYRVFTEGVWVSCTLMPAMYPGTRNRPCEIDESYHAEEWEGGKCQTPGQLGLRPKSFCMLRMNPGSHDSRF